MSENRPASDGNDRSYSDSSSANTTEPADVLTLLADLRALAEDVESPRAREEIDETKHLLRLAGARGLIDSGVRRLRPRDAAEALVGSVVFASPLLVEDGIFDIATHLFRTTVAGFPVFLFANLVFVVLMTYALVEWTGRDREHHRLLGIVPTRVLMILAVSFVVSAILMTVWGRVGDWSPASEALARIAVLWTVGSIGAGLGDLLAGSDGRNEGTTATGESATAVAAATPQESASADVDAANATTGAERSASPAANGAVDDLAPGELVAELNERFETLYDAVGDDQSRRAVRRIEARANSAAADDLFGVQIRKYTSRDVAEAFVGSVVFAIPLLVEDGVFDVAEYFLTFTIGRFPVFFVVNAAFVLVMISAILYWTGPQDVRVVRPILGVLPRRLVGISLVSFLTAAALMTMWGRVDGWADPTVAVARISAVWTVASFGAALGDVLPGESSGDDINDQLADLGDRVADAADDRDWGR